MGSTGSLKSEKQVYTLLNTGRVIGQDIWMQLSIDNS